jgi:hypothetical protein
MDVTVFEIVPPPLYRGHRLLKANQRIPYGLWYGELRRAISYATWAARDYENAEIRVYERGGVLKERRAPKGDPGPARLGACS